MGARRGFHRGLGDGLPLGAAVVVAVGLSTTTTIVVGQREKLFNVSTCPELCLDGMPDPARPFDNPWSFPNQNRTCGEYFGNGMDSRGYYDVPWYVSCYRVQLTAAVKCGCGAPVPHGDDDDDACTICSNSSVIPLEFQEVIWFQPDSFEGPEAPPRQRSQTCQDLIFITSDMSSQDLRCGYFQGIAAEVCGCPALEEKEKAACPLCKGGVAGMVPLPENSLGSMTCHLYAAGVAGYSRDSDQCASEQATVGPHCGCQEGYYDPAVDDAEIGLCRLCGPGIVPPHPLRWVELDMFKSTKKRIAAIFGGCYSFEQYFNPTVDDDDDIQYNPFHKSEIGPQCDRPSVYRQEVMRRCCDSGICQDATRIQAVELGKRKSRASVADPTNCESLAVINEFRRRSFCEVSARIRRTCPETCDRCASPQSSSNASASSRCADKNATVFPPVEVFRKNCKWLARRRTTAKIRKFCRNSLVAARLCPKTCGTCANLAE